MTTRTATCKVEVRLIRLQAGDAGAVHAQLQVVQLLPQLLDVALLAVQLHLLLVAVRALLRQLLWTERTSTSSPRVAEVNGDEVTTGTDGAGVLCSNLVIHHVTTVVRRHNAGDFHINGSVRLSKMKIRVLINEKDMEFDW